MKVYGIAKSEGVGSVSVRADVSTGAAGTLRAGTEYAHDYTGYTTHSQTWTTNPATGSAWTVDDINGTSTDYLKSFGIAARNLTTGEAIRWTCVWLEVVYQ